MKAFALTRYLPIDHPESFVDTDLTEPEGHIRHRLSVVLIGRNA